MSTRFLAIALPFWSVERRLRTLGVAAPMVARSSASPLRAGTAHGAPPDTPPDTPHSAARGTAHSTARLPETPRAHGQRFGHERLDTHPSPLWRHPRTLPVLWGRTLRETIDIAHQQSDAISDHSRGATPLRARPAIVLDVVRGARIVFAACPLALAAGVRCGMTLAHARALCASAAGVDASRIGASRGLPSSSADLFLMSSPSSSARRPSQLLQGGVRGSRDDGPRSTQQAEPLSQQAEPLWQEAEPLCHEFEQDVRGDRLALRRIAAWLLRFAPVVAIDRDESRVPIDPSGDDLTGSEGEAEQSVRERRERHDAGGRHGGRHGGGGSLRDVRGGDHGGRAILLADLTGCERLLCQTYGTTPTNGATSNGATCPRAADESPRALGSRALGSRALGSRALGAEAHWAEWALAEELVMRLGRSGLTARAAVASTVGAAWAMATSSSASVPIAVIEPGREQEALGPLPIEALRIEPEQAAALREVQVERVEQLLLLDRTELGERFGRALKTSVGGRTSSSRRTSPRSRLCDVGGRIGGRMRTASNALDDVLRCIDRACGRIHEPLHGIRIAPACRTTREFDGPTTDHDVIAIAVADLVDRLSAMLRERLRGVRLLRLEAFRPSVPSVVIDVHFGLPTRRRGHLWALLSPRLDTLNKGDGIDRLVLSAVRVAKVGVAQGRMSQMLHTHQCADAKTGMGGRLDHSFDAGADASSLLAREMSSLTEVRARLSRSASTAECIDAITARFGPMAVRCPAPRGLHTPEHFATLVPAHDLASVVDACARTSWSLLPAAIRPTIVFPVSEPARVTPSLASLYALQRGCRNQLRDRESFGDRNPLEDLRTGSLVWRGETHVIVAVSAEERLDEAWWHTQYVAIPNERESRASRSSTPSSPSTSSASRVDPAFGDARERSSTPLFYTTRLYRRVALQHGLWLWMWRPVRADERSPDVEGSSSRSVSGASSPPSASSSSSFARSASQHERWYVQGVWA